MRYFEFVHNLGTHSWDIPTLIVVVILIIMILVHHTNQKKRQNDFEEEMDKKIQEIREGNDRRREYGTGRKQCRGIKEVRV